MSLKVGQSITLGDGRQGIIKYISPRTEVVMEYATGDQYPTSSYERREVIVILRDSFQITTKVRTGSSYFGTNIWSRFY